MFQLYLLPDIIYESETIPLTKNIGPNCSRYSAHHMHSCTARKVDEFVSFEEAVIVPDPEHDDWADEG